MSTLPSFINLVGANSTGTVFDNLAPGSPAVQAAIRATLHSALQTQLSPASAIVPVPASLLGNAG